MKCQLYVMAANLFGRTIAVTGPVKTFIAPSTVLAIEHRVMDRSPFNGPSTVFRLEHCVCKQVPIQIVYI